MTELTLISMPYVEAARLNRALARGDALSGQARLHRLIKLFKALYPRWGSARPG